MEAVARVGSSLHYLVGSFDFLDDQNLSYSLVANLEVEKEAGFDSTQMRNEEGTIIMMYLYEQMVWHNLAQKVLVGLMVKIFFVQMFLKMVDGRLSFYYLHIMELGYPWFDNRVCQVQDVYYHL